VGRFLLRGRILCRVLIEGNGLGIDGLLRLSCRGFGFFLLILCLTRLDILLFRIL